MKKALLLWPQILQLKTDEFSFIFKIVEAKDLNISSLKKQGSETNFHYNKD